ncbi:MAG: hypothetical protein ACLUL2_12310 [Blautia sp.]
MEEKILDLLAEICEDDIVKEDLKTELFQSGLLPGICRISGRLGGGNAASVIALRLPGRKWIPRKSSIPKSKC